MLTFYSSVYKSAGDLHVVSAMLGLVGDDFVDGQNKPWFVYC